MSGHGRDELPDRARAGRRSQTYGQQPGWEKLAFLFGGASAGTACGNDLIDAGETCDGSDLSGDDCSDRGFPGGTLACNADCEGWDTRGCDDISASGTPQPPYDPLPVLASRLAERDDGSYKVTVIGEAKNGGNFWMCQDVVNHIETHVADQVFTVTLGDMIGSGWQSVSDSLGPYFRRYAHWPVQGDQENTSGMLGFYNLPAPSYFFDLGTARFFFAELGHPDFDDSFVNAQTLQAMTLQAALEEASGLGMGSYVFSHRQWFSWPDNPGLKFYCTGDSLDDDGNAIKSCAGSTTVALFEANNVRMVFQADNQGYGRVRRNGIQYVHASYVGSSGSARVYCAENNGWGHGVIASCSPNCVDDTGSPDQCQPFFVELNIQGSDASLMAIEANTGHVLDATVACADGIDNDGDGTVDLADPGCLDIFDSSERGTDICDDGQDNDGDGTLDFALAGGDPGCVSLGDFSEREAGGAECDDTVDNEPAPDGLIDYPDDPDCTGPADSSELDTPPAGDPLPIVLGDEWSYLIGTTCPGTPPAQWNEVGFDDASWSVGPSGFGYGGTGDCPESRNTDVGAMEDSDPVLYIRKEFGVADPGALTSLVLQIAFDDGFVAYLNSVEVARDYLSGADTCSALAASHECDNNSGSDEAEFLSYDLGAHLGLLQTGLNVIAISGHNTSVTSSDFFLAPKLSSAP